MRFYDPTGTRYGIPTYPFHLAPDGLLTRRQLRARGLRPAGQPVAAQLMWFSRLGEGPRVAYLYRLDLARPVRAMTPAKATALAAAMRARRTCPACHLDAGYVIPTSLGTCVPCTEPQTRAA
ncbi:RRQRL motif-containing zinc-binding protein [Streptacidiphilus carbonis]|uniref:RRQRL motif-containing zinc-binding protein n=1 Tax=Streptacidiphilus carbonis TaxID=105422 RepID=UPI0005A79449|nr:RRQRL motif-containing zinc-binding protein [Streptacidiphilus carbonis]